MRQETELLIPAQTGNRTKKMYKSTDMILSVDHGGHPKRKDMQLIIDLIILIILIIFIILIFLFILMISIILII